MRKLLAVLLTALVSVGVLPALSADGTQEPPFDWIEVVITAGSDGALVQADVVTMAESRGAGPFQTGWGVSLDGYGLVNIWDRAWGPVAVRTTAQAGELDVEPFTTPEGGPGFDWISAYHDLRPGEVASLLLFAPEGRIVHWSVFDEVHRGSATVDVRKGSGSSSVRAVPAAAEGLGASAGGAALALDLAAERTLAEGVVGAMDTQSCRCTGSWISPGGRTNTWDTTADPFAVAFDQQPPEAGFAGAPGSWEWRWSGVRTPGPIAEPAMVGYAPIGDGWTRYEKGWADAPARPAPPPPPEREPGPAAVHLSEDGISWATFDVEAEAGATLETFLTFSDAAGFGSVAKSTIHPRGGSGFASVWTDADDRTEVRLGDLAVVEEVDSDQEGGDGWLRSTTWFDDPMQVTVVLYAVAEEMGSVDFWMDGEGITVVGARSGPAFLHLTPEFRSTARAAAVRDGLGARADAAGQLVKDAEGTLFAMFGDFSFSPTFFYDTAVLETTYPDGERRLGWQWWTGDAGPGRYVFDLHAAAAAGIPSEIAVFGADIPDFTPLHLQP